MINTGKHLAFTLKVELSEIDHILANIDNFYYEKEIIKKDVHGNPKIKNGKIQARILNPSIKRLKVIQKRINKYIFQKLQMPEYAYGAIKGRDNISNAKKHQGKKYIFTTDLKDFFPTIGHKKVYQTLISFGFSPTVSRYLTKLTTYKGRLPQGAPTSPILANLVFTKTGAKLAQIARANGLIFSSFVDDLTFSSPTDFKEKANEIISTIQLDGYKISHKKTTYKTKLPTVTGIIVKNNCLDLPKDYKEKMNDSSQSKDRQNGLRKYYERVKARR